MPEIEDENKLANDYMTEGRQAFYEKKFEEAGILIQNAIHLFKKLKNPERYAIAINTMGVIYAAMGNESMAVDYYLQGLECANANHFEHLFVVFYNNIGTRYQELGEHKTAITYFLKAEKALPYAVKEEHFHSWKLVTLLNLMASYLALGNYKESEVYMNESEALVELEEERVHDFVVLSAKCRLYWLTDRKNYVYEHLKELADGAKEDKNSTDYLQDMLDVCELFRWMKEYAVWEQTIHIFEEYVSEQNSIYLKLRLTEMWIDYYHENGEEENFVKACVEHARVYKEYKKQEREERVAAIDIKIKLQEKEMERRDAERKSNMDELTRLGNRYLLKRDIYDAVEKAAGQGAQLAIGILDIDCFKQHNDTYGHLHGDECLKMVAEILDTIMKDRGKAYRFGGDEFVLLFNCGNEKEVEQTAKHIKERLAGMAIENKNSTVEPVITLSQGYSCFMPYKKEKYSAVLERADQVLYQVKKNGKNGYQVKQEGEF